MHVQNLKMTSLFPKEAIISCYKPKRLIITMPSGSLSWHQIT